MSPQHSDDLLGSAWPRDLFADEPYPPDEVDEIQDLLGELVETLAE